MNRYESTKKIGFWGIIGNIFLLIIKISVAFYSHSQSILADALNSAGDIFSSIMTSIGNKIASIPNDEDHNFGHGKAEYIFSLLISIFMLIIACKILVDSIMSIITKKEFIFSYFLIIVCVITIITKFILYLYCKNEYKKHSNILIKASMKDHRNDMLLTTGTLLSIVLGRYGFYYFDSIFGALISVYILISGIGIFLESYKILMDVSINTEEKEEIIDYILKNKKEVIGVSEFSTIATGYKYIAIITIDVNGALDTFKTHHIADALEQEITNAFSKIYKVIIHVNPIRQLMNKEELRKKYKDIRDNIKDKDKKSREIIKKLQNTKEYKESRVIAVYSSILSEVKTEELIQISLDKKTVVLPKLNNDNRLEFYEIKSLNDLEEGKFHIKEPKINGKKAIKKEKIDLIIVPGVCFDKNKNRIGYGKGCYDKYLRDAKIKKIGICYNEQMVEEINSNSEDIKMDYIITENKIY